jgi:hypothetical protein
MMSFPEERPSFEEPLTPIGRMQSGLVILFVTPSPKNNYGDSNRFVNDEYFFNKQKPLSTTIAKGVLSNGEHMLITVMT